MPLGCVGIVSPVISDAWIQSRGTPENLRNAGQIKILDCGIGNGFWGLASRQWLGESYIMGIEVWDKYRGPAWQYYDWIHLTTIEQYLRDPRCQGDRFDVIYLLDVIEHFDTKTGLAVLQSLRERLNPNGALYVGTPGLWIEQGAYEGNTHETHLSLWEAQQFRDLGGEILLDGSPCPQGYCMILARFGRL